MSTNTQSLAAILSLSPWSLRTTHCLCFSPYRTLHLLGLALPKLCSPPLLTLLAPLVTRTSSANRLSPILCECEHPLIHSTFLETFILKKSSRPSDSLGAMHVYILPGAWFRHSTSLLRGRGFALDPLPCTNTPSTVARSRGLPLAWTS